jgi:hypothetical protein
MQIKKGTGNIPVPPCQGLHHPFILFIFEKLQDGVVKVLKNELAVFDSPFLAGR